MTKPVTVPAKRGVGKPAFEPTAQQRKTVKTMSAHGVRQDDIAYSLDIDPKTLRKHFARELRMGMVEANSAVGETLWKMATSGNNVAASIFYAKSRMGWSEKQVIEHTGLNGGPIDVDSPSERIARRLAGLAATSAAPENTE